MAKKKNEHDDVERDLAATVQETGKALAYAHRALATAVKDFSEAAAWADRALATAVKDFFEVAAWADRALATAVKDFFLVAAWGDRALATAVKDFSEAAAWGDSDWDGPRRPISVWLGPVRAVAGVVARLRRGRPPYERAPITEVAERAIEGGVDPSLSAFRDRVRSLLELQHIPAPGDTVLKEICAPIYMRAQSAKK
jgi:hypothetical protein